MSAMTTPLTRPQASAAIADSGWRYLLGAIATSVVVDSIEQAAQVAQTVSTACGQEADQHLRLDLRPARVEITLRAASIGRVTETDIELSRRIDAAVTALGLSTGGATSSDGRRSGQLLEIAIDALDIAAILPFWRAVMGYADAPGDWSGSDVVDPVGQGPTIWFQQMDEPRPQRNRIHFDLTVPHDEAPARIEAALAAGGHLVSAEEARAFWILADAEGNEVCVCTWQDRDPPT
jgi:4a-hydroxytetrahydrobiopterin dehydratase